MTGLRNCDTHTHTHTHTLEYYSSINKNEIMAFAGKWMELENTMLSEINQSPKNQRQNVFPDKWMLIYNGGGVGVREEWRNFRLCRGK